MHRTRAHNQGFTLIELSIVLVIIGLIVGGVLVGQDLIRAAGVRATITQIEKFNTAANTFKGKYGYLPGDIKDPDASNFGFQPRGSLTGQGDGNGVLYGFNGGQGNGEIEDGGETLLFWRDLSDAHLIDGGFTTATALQAGDLAATQMGQYFPEAKLGKGNYVYVYSAGQNVNAASAYQWQSTGINYFGISAATGVDQLNGMSSAPGMTVAEAYSIDKKMDDGLPQSGSVVAEYINLDIYWTDGIDAIYHPPSTAPAQGAATTCIDNNNVNGPKSYSLEISNGSNVNCALSFQFQ